MEGGRESQVEGGGVAPLPPYTSDRLAEEEV